MMNTNTTYFAEMFRMNQLLKRHGFESWPSEEEQLMYLIDTNERIDALSSALGLKVEKDIQGRWFVSHSDSAVM